MTSPAAVDPVDLADPVLQADPVEPAVPAAPVPPSAVSLPRPRSLPVLAPLLPLLLLVGAGIAGMTDPPAPLPGSAGAAVSRLHIPAPGPAADAASSGRLRH